MNKAKAYSALVGAGLAVSCLLIYSPNCRSADRSEKTPSTDVPASIENTKNTKSAAGTEGTKSATGTKSTKSATGTQSTKSATGTQSAENVKFSDFVDRYIDARLHSNPDEATVLGIHKYDHLAPDLSERSIREEISHLKAFQNELKAMSASSLNKQENIDRRLIDSDIKARLLENEALRSWQTNPDIYSSQSSSMIYDLISRDFAPLEERLVSVIAREKQIPKILAAARKNLKNPPKIYTEVAIEQLPGIIDLFKNSIPEKFKSLNASKLKEFKELNQTVINEFKSYQKFLQDEVLPRSTGNFALGEENFSRKLLYEEMEDKKIDLLLVEGEAEMKRLQDEFKSCAAEIDKNKTCTEVFTEIASEHDHPDQLLSAVSALLNKLKDFCRQKDLMSVPEQGQLKVMETPAFMRALTFAAMDTPGPFEMKAKEAYYYVTLPEANWSAERVEEHMRAFCKYDLINTSVHEAYPGHYLQALWLRQAPSKTSKILGCNSNVEGWAHYCEQLCFEQGLENGDKKLKMVMLHDALLRCARYIVGIRMHCKGMSMHEGIDFFINEAYQEKANAERETKRGTMDPTYMVYTLGKLQLIALREEYKKLKGAEFSLRDFHDRVLACGTPPVSIIREIILDNLGAQNTLSK